MEEEKQSQTGEVSEKEKEKTEIFSAFALTHVGHPRRVWWSVDDTRTLSIERRPEFRAVETWSLVSEPMPWISGGKSIPKPSGSEIPPRRSSQTWYINMVFDATDAHGRASDVPIIREHRRRNDFWRRNFFLTDQAQTFRTVRRAFAIRLQSSTCCNGLSMKTCFRALRAFDSHHGDRAAPRAVVPSSRVFRTFAAGGVSHRERATMSSRAATIPVYLSIVPQSRTGTAVTRFCMRFRFAMIS